MPRHLKFLEKTQMTINDSIFTNGERILFSLRSLYLSAGYHSYHMSKFEEYDFYAKNKEFLVSDNVITFTDTNGKLMALKPDVTLSIIKNAKDTPDVCEKVFYNENVYRVSKDNDSFREIMQIGLECFGKVDGDEVLDVLKLAAKSLKCISRNAVLDVTDLGILEKIVASLGIPQRKYKDLYHAISEKNMHEVEKICLENAADENAYALLEVITGLHGKPDEIVGLLKRSIPDFGYSDILSKLAEKFASDPDYDIIRFDFSMTEDTNYYNGIVFKGYIDGVPSAVLSGGQYNRLMQKMKRKSSAIGFAVYTDKIERIDFADSEKRGENDVYVNIALPKGRLGEKVYAMFADAGYECPSILEQNRKLIFENEEKKVRYFWVKPSDVAIYVERGAADIGVAGKDILLEYSPDVYELVDLREGKCRMAVAGPKSFVDDPSKTLRVATKFSNCAKQYFSQSGRDIDIIHLNGSIEIAPILGLSDVIFDIVETGRTLKENDLEVKETAFPISARLISNKASFKFKSFQIEKIAEAMAKLVEDKND